MSSNFIYRSKVLDASIIPSINVDEVIGELFVYKGYFYIHEFPHDFPYFFTFEFDLKCNMEFSILYKHITGGDEGVVTINQSTEMYILSKSRSHFSAINPFVCSSSIDQQFNRILNKGEIVFRFYRHNGEILMKVTSIKIASACNQHCVYEHEDDMSLLD